MRHLGDITQIKGYNVPKVDIVVGGSPCQDLSVAGKRAGLAGERSGLFMEQIRIIKEMRESDRAVGRADDDCRPRFMVWENVVGAFSSNKGEDFRAVLEETAKIADPNATIPRPNWKWTKSGCIMGNRWSIAWRVHDAQFWGVPQRRKRIALVADFAGGVAPEILFERKGLQGCAEESGQQGERTAATVERGIGEASKSRLMDAYQHHGYRECDTCGTLTAGQNNGVRGDTPLIVYDASRRHNYQPFGKVCETVQAHYGTGGGNVPLVVKKNALVYSIDEKMGRTYVHENQGNTLAARDYKQPQAICVGCDLYNHTITGQVGATLNATSCTSGSQSGPSVMNDKMIVRRLTPLECERLQGFPDHWTDIGDWVDSKGKKHKGESDSPRYKALGNSIALPFWQWMAERMVKYLKEPTMCSLFDGIGGFPLVFSRVGCKPVWASEIEEFPMAVTKIRFPEEE